MGTDDLQEKLSFRDAARKAARETPVRWRRGPRIEPGEWIEGTLGDLLRHEPEEGNLFYYWVDFTQGGSGRSYRPPTDASGTYEWYSVDDRGREVHTPSLAAGVLVQYLDHVASRARWEAQDTLGLYFLRPEVLM